MVARVTLAEIDAVRMSIPKAVQRFEEIGAPRAARGQDGYEGCYVLATPEGKALVMTFWARRGCGRGRDLERALARTGGEVRDADAHAARA